MNIYDFDNTIYKGDTNIDLILYSFVRHPFSVSISLIKTIFIYIKYKRKLVSFEKVKEVMLSFLFKIKDLDKYLDKFVDSHLKNIKSWYIKNHKDDDIVISASYELWVKKFCNKINIKNVIGTVTDNKGNIIGKNCKNKEKINRLNKEFPGIKINNAYSDSLDDISMFEVSTKAYLVKGNELIKYK